jgi:hypothetical protein
MIEISLDDVATWPRELVAAFEAHEGLLRAHFAEQKKNYDDDLWKPPYQPAYVPMARRPTNSHAAARRIFLDDVRARFFAVLALRGFHSTRLTDEEVEAILSEGMTPPNGAMLQRRIAAARNSGLITANIAARLGEQNEADYPSRAGLIYFVFTAALLKSESGVGSPFRYWGGEALYSRHDADPETGPILASIGSPRIIEASLPVRAILDGFLDCKMAGQYLAAIGVDRGTNDFESRTELPIPASWIRRVISRSDPEFEFLTESSTWCEPV